MKPQAFQYGELRDANDTIIRDVTYGKKTPLATKDNVGVIDYIMNNFDVIQKEIEASGITSDADGNPIVSEDVKLLFQADTSASNSASAAASSATAAKLTKNAIVTGVIEKHFRDSSDPETKEYLVDGTDVTNQTVYGSPNYYSGSTCEQSMFSIFDVTNYL